MNKRLTWIKMGVCGSALFFLLNAVAQPDLTPYQPQGWSDAITVANNQIDPTNDSPALNTSDSLYVSWAVANFGDEGASDFDVDLYLDGVDIVSFPVPFTVNPFTYIFVTNFSIGSLSAGTHTVEIVADSQQNVETGETDNTYTKTFTIQSGQPDLTRSTDGLSGTNLTAGDNVTASVTITNQPCVMGAAGAGAFHVGWYFSTDPGFSGATPFFETAVNGCASNSTVSFTQGITINPSVPSGTYYLGYMIDDESELSECSRANNGIFSFAISVTGIADLTPQNVSVNPNPVAVGGSATVSYTVANIGTVAAPPSHTKVQIRDGAQNVVVEQVFPTAAIAAGSSTNDSQILSLAGANPGSYNAYVIADYDHEVAQGANTNDDTSAATQFAIGSGLIIIPNFDSTITSDPQASTIEATINSALVAYETNFSDPITVNITFKEMSGGLGENSTYIASIPYSSYRSALASHATTADDATTLLIDAPNTANNPVTGDPNIVLKLPLSRALGFGINPPAGQPDGTVSLKTSICNLSPAQTDPSKYSLAAVVWHETDELLGLGSTLDEVKGGGETLSGAVEPEDLFRYGGPGARSFTTNVSATSYFSLDGTNDLAQFNQVASGDFGDWYSYYGGEIPEVQDAFGTPGSAPLLNVELRVLDVIGFTLVAAKTNQTITFGPLSNRSIGEPPFGVSATASSGQPVSFSILSGPATISSTNVTLTGTGTVTVRASQGGNANNYPAPNVDQPFTVFARPTVSSTRSGTNFVLSWSTNVPGFTLLTTTNIATTNAWAVVSPSPFVVNGQYTVTNGFTNRTQFYRLKK